MCFWWKVRKFLLVFPVENEEACSYVSSAIWTSVFICFDLEIRKGSCASGGKGIRYIHVFFEANEEVHVYSCSSDVK